MKIRFVVAAVVIGCLFLVAHDSLAGGAQSAAEKTKDKSVRARGAVESASYVDVRSPITAKILKIEPEGVVKKGDLLFELDVMEIRNQVNAQKIDTERARAKLVQIERLREASSLEMESNIQTSERSLKLAGLARERYLGEGGEYEVELKEIAGQIEIAKKRLSVAEKQLARMKEQAAVVTAAAVDQAELVVCESKAALTVAEAKERLLRDRVHPHRKAELEFHLEQTKSEFARARLESTRTLERTAAAVAAQQRALQVENDKLKRKEHQLKSTRIVSPRTGMFIYAKLPASRTRTWSLVKPGALVREGQTLVRFPDMNKLQLKVLIPATQIERVKLGQRATVAIDAFPDQLVRGEVTEVSRTAENFGLARKEFAVVISIAKPPANARLGMTGTAEIDLSESEKKR